MDQAEARRIIRRELTLSIVAITEAIDRQLTVIYGHPTFSQFQARWQGLKYLVDEVTAQGDGEIDAQAKTIVKVLSATEEELSEDFASSELVHSRTYHLLVDEMIGTRGADPCGLLVIDFEFRLEAAMTLWTPLASIAQKALSPLVAGVHPGVFDVANYAVMNGAGRSTHFRLNGWNQVRQRRPFRFMALALPRIVVGASRPPYHGPLLASAAYALAVVVASTFRDAGWFADLNGVADLDGVGWIPNPVDRGMGHHGRNPRHSVELACARPLERHFNDLGMTVICPSEASSVSRVLATPTCFSCPDPATEENAGWLDLRYVLCYCRIAQYCHILDRYHSGVTSERLHDVLMNWLTNYCTTDSDPSDESKAHYPLQSASVDVSRSDARHLIVRMKPHFVLTPDRERLGHVTSFTNRR